MTTVAEVVDAVIGGDTHRDSHTLEMVSPVGATLSTCEIDNTPEGYAEALAWIAQHAPGGRIVIGLEGTRSYGIGLLRALQAVGLQVVEVERPKRKARRRGKSDAIDARLAALAILPMDPARLPVPRSDGAREALRLLLIGRSQLATARTAQANQLHAMLLTGDDDDRAIGKGSFTQKKLRAIASRDPRVNTEVDLQVRRSEATRLANALLDADKALATNHRQLKELIDSLHPTLLKQTGVGPVSAAQALVTFSHPGRFRNEAAFAMLAGAAPLPASSGQRQDRHRLNRTGDRAMNRALHTIAMTRWRTCPTTRAYIERRRTEGLNDPEIRRCLKRYIARQLYRTLTPTLDNP